MRTIPQAAQRGNSPTPAQITVQMAAKALLDADRHQIDKSDRLFLQAVKRHGRVNGEGRDRLAQLAWLVNGGGR